MNHKIIVESKLKKIFSLILLFCVLLLQGCTITSKEITPPKPLIASGNDFVVYYDSNTLYSIGNNDQGQLGISSEIAFSSDFKEIPIQLDEDDMIVDIQAGYAHIGILTSSGRVFLWGSNAYRQIKNDNDVTYNKPQEITSYLNLADEEKVTALRLGGFHTGIVTSFNRVVLFGLNTSGQIGNGKTSLSVGYHEFQYDLNQKIQLELGNEHSGLVINQDIYMWGSNFNGQLGLGDVSNQVLPQKITSILFENDEEVFVSLGVGITMVHTNLGNVYGFGKSVYGLLGTQTDQDIFEPKKLNYFSLDTDEYIRHISFGYGHATFQSSNRRFFNLGNNSLSQIGISDTSILYIPKIVKNDEVFGQNDVVDIVNGGFYQFVLLNDSSIFAVGYNAYIFNQDQSVNTFQKII